MSSVNSMRTEVTEYDRISLCNGYFFAALASVGWSRCGDTKQLIYRSTNEDWWSTPVSYTHLIAVILKAFAYILNG